MWTSKLSVGTWRRARACWEGGGTDDAAGRRDGLGLAVQLVAEALDVVEAVGDDNVVAREHSLYGRIFLRAGILLGPGRVIDMARDTQRLIVDEVHLEPAGARIGRVVGNLGLAVLLQLQRACRLPRGRVS